MSKEESDFYFEEEYGSWNGDYILWGDKIEEYEIFRYDWFYTNIHKMTEFAEAALQAIVNDGQFNRYFSPKFDHRVRTFANNKSHECVLNEVLHNRGNPSIGLTMTIWRVNG